MAATTWFADGGVVSFDATTGQLAAEKTKLAVGGTVDSNAVTRGQYAIAFDTVASVARIRLSLDDWIAAKTTSLGGDPANGVTAQAFIIPASYFGSATPTTGQIILYAVTYGLVYRANEWSPGVAIAPPNYQDTTFNIVGPSPSILASNTKYWMCVVPVQAIPGSDPKSAHVLHSYSTNPEQARAISFWTNRTPSAPTISSPTPNQVVTAGSLVNLAISKNDPDAIFGGTTQNYTDTAGVQVQYAPRPTTAVPNPPWTDLPFADSGAVLRKGWWISGASANTAGEGLAVLASGSTVPIRCGAGTPTAGHGFLPAGTWQIRVRTFDYGHGFPATTKPLNNSAGTYTANTFPASNTSPWSTPVVINVTAQVPTPIPLSPIENAAVTEGSTVTLVWQYRNTAVPPFAQSKRSVRIRMVGTTTWTDLAVNQSSGSASIAVTGITLVSGNAYEWQVNVTDTDNQSSGWSPLARFWVVPAPGSGGTVPLPSSTIDGATLGCGTHTVEVYRRGGRERVGVISDVSYVKWGRLRDDISDAEIRISGWGIDCGNLLAQLEPWAYEIRITRDNGYSKDKVWEGPITRLTYEADLVTINASDVMRYAYRRIIKQKMSDNVNGATVVDRATRVLQNVFASDDPNVLAYLTVIDRSDDAMQYRSLPEYSRTAYEEIDDMAANAGLDYTTVGRSIMVWGTKHRTGLLPEFRDKDLGNSPIVSVYGMAMANRYAVSDGNGIWGEATRLDSDGHDPYYGLVEMVSSSWASDSQADVGTFTQDGINKVRASFAEFAERSISDRYPAPTIVRIPDNTTLNPDAVVSIQHLVPGVAIPLRSSSTLREVVMTQKLDSVSVTEENGRETITVTMSPFTRDDDSGEDTEE